MPPVSSRWLSPHPPPSSLPPRTSASPQVGRLHHTLEEHIHANTQLLADNSQRQVEIKAKEDEIRALRVGAQRTAGGREDTARCARRGGAVAPACCGPPHGAADPLSLACVDPWPLPCVLPVAQEEGAKAGKAREVMQVKLQQLEKQKGEVERMRDELKVGTGAGWGGG